jgi:hypothetical protein
MSPSLWITTAASSAHWSTARPVYDRSWLLNTLSRLTDLNDARQPMHWQVSDAPARYIDRMMNAIVGIEIPIDRIEGKLKVSQDEDLQDQWHGQRAAQGCAPRGSGYGISGHELACDELPAAYFSQALTRVTKASVLMP